MMVELSRFLSSPLLGWMEEFLDGQVPDETEATCMNCAMVSQPGSSRDGREYRFSPDTKCCTHIPTLPNFLVGQLLADPAPELARGRASLQARMATGRAVTPMGLGVADRDLNNLRRKSDEFGQDRSLLCPHYLDEGGGQCSIWRHRNSTCSTYFCKYVRGAVGRTFWRNAFMPLLSNIEFEVSFWVVREMGLGEEALRRLFSSAVMMSMRPIDVCDANGAPDAEAYAEVWGDWRGREAEFFQGCAARVADLRWSDVLRIGGPQMQEMAQQTRQAYVHLLDEELPGTLTVGGSWVARRGPETSLVAGYSPLHLIELPNALIDVLKELDGMKTADVPEWLAREKGIQLEPGLLRRLIDFDVLRATRAPASTPRASSG